MNLHIQSLGRLNLWIGKVIDGLRLVDTSVGRDDGLSVIGLPSRKTKDEVGPRLLIRVVVLASLTQS
jgi:hypothetical protein